MSELISTIQLRVPPELKAFIIHRSVNKKTSASEYIRKLIEADKQDYKKKTNLIIAYNC